MKKNVYIIIALIVFIGVGTGIFVFKKIRSSAVVTPVVSGEVTPSQAPVELATWTDPAGFTFQYPKSIQVNKHDEDQENYAHVELTQKDYPGTIIVWAKDTTAPDAASWVKGDKAYTGGTVFETTMGGMTGKKVLLTTPKKRIVSGVVDEGVVFYVEGSFEDSDYWKIAYDSVTTSFAFVVDETQGSQGAISGDESAVDEEEVVN